jgi:hypothetical protein
MEKIKLVTQDYKTRAGEKNETLWEVGKRVEATGTGGLCTDGVIHFYDSIWVALVMNTTHANIPNPKAIVIEVGEVVAHDGTKGGSKWATMLREIPVPEMTTEQRVEIAIRCALAVYSDPEFIAWANKWLSGEDRSREAAWSAARAAWSAARAAAGAAGAAAAAEAAMAAARAAEWAAEVAEWAAEAAGAAAGAALAAAAAWAADAAGAAAQAAASKGVNIAAICAEVMERT